MNSSIWHTGTVIRGLGNGRKLGFPTANIRPDSPLELEKGVYAARIEIDGVRYKGMFYVGTRPSLGLTENTYEVHLLHFSGNLYGKTLSFELMQFIRPEQKFESMEALVEQLKKDLKFVDAYESFAEYKKKVHDQE